MRKVIFESSVSVDGYIEGPHGELDWLLSDTEQFDAFEFLAGFDTIFYSRKTYERFGVLPTADTGLSDEERQFVYAMHGMRKYVFSRTEKHVPGNGMVVSENLEAEVLRIRDEDGKNILFCGGADMLRTFADLDLIDEYVLTVHPVLLSSGKPLFEGLKKPMNLKLFDKRSLKSGIVILYYRPGSRT